MPHPKAGKKGGAVRTRDRRRSAHSGENALGADGRALLRCGGKGGQSARDGTGNAGWRGACGGLEDQEQRTREFRCLPEGQGTPQNGLKQEKVVTQRRDARWL